MKDIYKGKKIELVNWLHLQDNPKNPIEAFEKWEEEQKEKYKFSDLIKEITKLASDSQIPLSQEEINNIEECIENHSGIPILSFVKSNKNKALLYLGAGNDIGHTSLFMSPVNFLVDGAYSKEIANSYALSFQRVGYDVKKKLSDIVFKLDMELNGNKKEIILIKEDLKNYKSIWDIIKNQGYPKISTLINKKTSLPYTSIPFLDNIKEKGFFLQSDWNVFKELKGFKELWYGTLNSYRLQAEGGFEECPAKLFQKI